jgi:hypothetical protein
MQHALLNDWKTHEGEFLFHLLALEGPGDGKCQSCHTEPLQFRCLDCFGGPSFCQQCCLDRHHVNPFHKIQMWNGKCFLPSDLHHLGLVLHLGHSGGKCPAHQEGQDDIGVPLEGGDGWEDEHIVQDIITVVHTTGVYKRRVRWCGCQARYKPYIQLLNMQLYPATTTRPETAFTFDLLDHFYIDAMECNTSANNFFNKLRRLSSNAFPHTITVSTISLNLH